MPGAEDNEKDVASQLADSQNERRRLERKLETQSSELNHLQQRFQRYAAALRGSRVVVYTQDLDLRYTSISSPLNGREVEDFLGRTDEEILSPAKAATLVALKRKALATGEAARTEVSGDDKTCQDLHIEPLRSDGGEIVGLSCASVDVTERKEGEAHLRLLLRELTHRSKNLLAVIQGMARQTARHAGSIDGFLTQFSARLQALAASHDLLVRQSWYGASLTELIRSQLAPHIERTSDRIVLDGPDIVLKPEAAQNLGLAIHELAVNAEKFGALSVPDGRLSITWGQREREGTIELDWSEHLGPKVKPRRKKGFGSMVIEGNLSRALNAEVNLEFAPDGLRCHVVIPASQVLTIR